MASIESRLRGIASCATQCGCCELHAQIAGEALRVLERAYIALICRRCGAFLDENERCPGCAGQCVDCG
jgi:hypothetical protein